VIKRSKVEIIDSSEDEEERVSYCKECLKYNVQVPLKNRLYPEGQIAVDSNNWLQCYNCGSIFAADQVQKEPTIKDIVVKIDNPHDIAKNQFLGVDRRKISRLKKNQEIDNEYETINDEELKGELINREIQLISYSET